MVEKAKPKGVAMTPLQEQTAKSWLSSKRNKDLGRSDGLLMSEIAELSAVSLKPDWSAKPTAESAGPAHQYPLMSEVMGWDFESDNVIATAKSMSSVDQAEPLTINEDN